jgi:hypothetical protein
MRRAVTPVLRRRRLPHLAGSRCLPNPESSPWSLYSGAGLLRGGEGVHSSDDGDSLRTVDPHRFSRNRYLPLTFPAHRTTSAHADVGKRFEVTGAALRAVLSGANVVSGGGNLVVLRCRRLRGRANPEPQVCRFAAVGGSLCLSPFIEPSDLPRCWRAEALPVPFQVDPDWSAKPAPSDNGAARCHPGPPPTQVTSFSPAPLPSEP